MPYALIRHKVDERKKVIMTTTPTLYRRVAGIALLLLMIGTLAYLSIDSTVWEALAIVKPGH